MSVLLTLVLLGCGGAKDADPEPTAEAAEPAAEAPPVATPEPAKADEDPCVKECLDGRRAEAIAWEEIERQCHAQCDGTAPTLEVE